MKVVPYVDTILEEPSIHKRDTSIDVLDENNDVDEVKVALEVKVDLPQQQDIPIIKQPEPIRARSRNRNVHTYVPIESKTSM